VRGVTITSMGDQSDDVSWWAIWGILCLVPGVICLVGGLIIGALGGDLEVLAAGVGLVGLGLALIKMGREDLLKRRAQYPRPASRMAAPGRASGRSCG
jgi:hypothetical protein